MKPVTVLDELREMLPAFAFWVLLPLPVATFWNIGPGRDFACLYLFVGAALVTAERISSSSPCAAEYLTGEVATHAWRTKMQSLVIAGLAAVCIFTFFSCSLIGTFDRSVPLFASLAIVPAITCVPFLKLWTKGSYPAIVVLFLLLGCIKLLGCIVVRAVYGPFALDDGRMDLPWTNPNLLVVLCVFGTLVLSVILFQLGKRSFIKQCLTSHT